MIKLLVLDTETTGVENAKLIEIGASSLSLEPGEGEMIQWDYASSFLINPGIKIPADAMAVHHITDEMVAGIGLASKEEAFAELLGDHGIGLEEISYFVAHNSKFDAGYLGDLIPEDAKWICTYKLGVHLYPDSPNHKLATLYYYLDLHNFDEYRVEKTAGAHRADIDTMICSSVFANMYNFSDLTLDQMVEISAKPALLTICSFGKHKGERWSEIPKGYLKWILGRDRDFDEDIIHTARTNFMEKELG